MQTISAMELKSRDYWWPGKSLWKPWVWACFKGGFKENAFKWKIKEKIREDAGSMAHKMEDFWYDKANLPDSSFHVDEQGEVASSRSRWFKHQVNELDLVV